MNIPLVLKHIFVYIRYKKSNKLVMSIGGKYYNSFESYLKDFINDKTEF